MTERLIEKWLPIAELGIESLRERTPMTPFPAPNRLHVWWARRPLVASRAAVLASLLPADADRAKFKHAIGIHGDPVEVRGRIDAAKRTKQHLGANVYGYPRAFSYSPSPAELEWFAGQFHKLGIGRPVLVDPTAGGGSIPLEASRLGLSTFANDLNPVAALILRATVEWPMRHGPAVAEEFRHLASAFVRRVEPRFNGIFPKEPDGVRVDGYLWARTIVCPYCDGLIPLSPNWRLASDGTGVRLNPDATRKVCDFEIVTKAEYHSEGTVTGGDAKCPYAACVRVVDGDEVKKQAQAGGMGEQLYAVVYRKRVEKLTKTGKKREAWERGYRAAVASDDNGVFIAERLLEKLPEWEALDIVPSERFPETSTDDRPKQYGMPLWRDMFSPRQLLGHGTGTEVFRELVAESGAKSAVRDAALVYLSFALDKILNYNSRMSVWMPTREVIANTFNRHDFAFCWSHAEMPPVVAGLGYEWALEQTAKCVDELVELARPDLRSKQGTGSLFAASEQPSPVVVTCGSGDSLTHVSDAVG